MARAGRKDHLRRALAAQGYSGGPVVDTYGRVIGLVNEGIGKAGFLTGANTGDNVIGYDFSSRWGGWRRTLCHAYPSGDIDASPVSRRGGAPPKPHHTQPLRAEQ